MSKTTRSSKATLQIENIGGIDHTTVELPSNVSILTGRNATNRTSFLQALMAALGSEDVSLKADADRGTVELSIGDDEYGRELTRNGGTVLKEGNPYLEDATLANLFAFLLESNDARRAIAGGADLRQVIMSPVDTSVIEEEISRLESEREELDAELRELEEVKARLPDLEEQRVDLEARIEEKREQLAEKEAEIEAFDADLDETREEKAELEERLDELRDVRGELDRTRDEIDSERESIDALETERSEIGAELEDLPDVATERTDAIEEDVQRIRGQVQESENTISELQSIIQFNQKTLEEGYPDLAAVLEDGSDTSDGESVTDELIEASSETVCWTCGSTVETSQIESVIDQLRELHRQKTEKRQSLRDEVQELQAEQNELRTQQNKRERLQEKNGEIEREIEERRERVDDLEEKRSELSSDVEQLEEEVQALQNDDYSDILDLHTEANRLELELERLENQLATVEEEIDETEGRINEQDQLESQREEVRSELNKLRTRIEDLERDAVEQFNDHMNEVLDLLDYQNLERIWIERTEREVREGRRTVSQRHFDLHVVRSTDDGTVYEDTVDHLSESEREVTGLVFALAGYLAHEVYEDVPFMLLDSIEAIDSRRIADLVDYLEQYVDYLVVALLPEDAAALDDDIHRVTEI